MLTERECRASERSQTPDHARYSVEVLGENRGDRTRWPDLVLEADGRRVAIEVEFSPKYTPRLAGIVAGLGQRRHHPDPYPRRRHGAPVHQLCRHGECVRLCAFRYRKPVPGVCRRHDGLLAGGVGI